MTPIAVLPNYANNNILPPIFPLYGISHATLELLCNIHIMYTVYNYENVDITIPCVWAPVRIAMNTHIAPAIWRRDKNPAESECTVITYERLANR